ncbi:MAG: SEA (Seh1-associated) complex subunit [Pleopsidium flavum]|nr:MAG: SEA (Seh1-associated) complex subunit [Pleopsidium flavum]
MTDFFRLNQPPPPPPPAPPLPPQRYANRATSALVRFAQPFIYGSRPASVQANRPEGHRGGFRPSEPRSSSPLSSKTTAHKTGIPIAALDISPRRTHVILAGREILKTVRVSGATCAEEFNLRSAIIAYASTHTPVGSSVSAKHKDQLAASDVKWSHGKFDSTIATAAANGRIVVYDINRTGVELARLHEHNRQVHKIAFNPHEGALLLSGSQDTTVKLWDMRAMSGERSVMTCRSMHRYVGNNEGVRDVKWSPTDGVEFATGTDNGVVQRWDLRKENAPLLKINAHEKTCHSIDWHPDGSHLASGSADKNVKVWDFTSTDRRLKPSWKFRAPQAVLNVRWRPPCWSSETRGQGSWQCTHLATSYDQRDPRVHLWDFRRSNVPFREFDRYNSAPTDLLWQSDDLLWTVGNEGMFTQTDIHFAPKVIERRSLQAFDWSPNDDINFFSQKRPQCRGSGVEDASADFLSSSKGRGSSGEKNSGSQSATDGSLEEGFLNSSFRKRHSKTSSTRSSKSLGGTPPPASHSMVVVNLDEALNQNGVYEPSPSIAWCHVLGTFDPYVFSYLAKNYKSPPEDPTKFVCPYRLDQIMHTICEQNAAHAEYAGQFRLSQSWRIIGLAIAEELQARATRNRHQRVRVDHARHDFNQEIPSIGSNQNNSHAARTEKFKPQVFNSLIETNRPSSILIIGIDSSSNMTTPLAKPVSGLPFPKDLPMDLYDVDEEGSRAITRTGLRSRLSTESMKQAENLIEDVVVHGRSPGPDALSNEQLALRTQEVQERRDKYHEERRAAIENYRPSPRPLLRLDHPIQPENKLSVGHLNRQNSNESFPMFSASTDSSHRERSMPSSFAESEKLGSPDPTPERWSEHAKHLAFRKLEDANPSTFVDPKSRLQFISTQAKAEVPGTDVSTFQEDLDYTENIVIRGKPSPMAENVRTNPYLLVRPSSPNYSRQLIVNAFPTRAGALPPGGPPISDPNVVNTSFMASDFTSRPTTNLHPSGIFSDPPWTTTHMVLKLVDYHTQKLSDAQMPAHLLLLLRSILNLMNENPLLKRHQAEALLVSYHVQLYSLGLHVPAAQVRKLSLQVSPDLAEQGMVEVHISLWCRQCEKPLENSSQNWAKRFNHLVCERCRNVQAPCAICWGRNPLPPSLSSSSSSLSTMKGEGEWRRGGDGGRALWSSCLSCGHGGHDGCLKTWFADASGSEGGCPVQGCLHDCVPGIRREEKIRKIAEEKVNKTRGMAKRDSWVVGESRAVEKARGALQTVILGEVSGGNPIYSGVTGAGSGSRKRVRLVAPDEESQESIEERKPTEARPIPKRSGLSSVGMSGWSAE